MCDQCCKYQAFFLWFLPQNSFDDILNFSGKHWRKTRSTEVRLKMEKLDTCVRKFKAALKSGHLSYENLVLQKVNLTSKKQLFKVKYVCDADAGNCMFTLY